jgi:EmrB/QacA subfamily drug resistance transporter
VITANPCDRGVVLCAPESGSPAASAQRWVLLASVLGSSMAFIDGTVVNVALPALQRELGATITDVQWVVEAYSLFLAALILVGGSLGDRYGRRRVFAWGTAVFAAASATCALAGDPRVLIMARAVQGIGAALLVPGSLALISAAFPERERGRAIGTWSAFSAITAALGPVFGGWLIEHVSWRWAFFVNIPIAAAVIALLFWRVPESRDPEVSGPLDAGGAALASLGLGGIVFGLIESSHYGWSDRRIVGALGLGVLASIAFVWVERRAAAPMVPFALFRSRDFLGTNLLTLFLYGALGAAFFFLPLVLIQVHGYSGTQAGASLLPLVILISVLSRWSGGLIVRFGPRLLLVAGPLVAAIGFALMAAPGIGGGYWRTFFPATVVLGLGMAITVAPLTTTVMNSVPTHQAGVASGINNAASRIAGLIAIAVMSLVVVHVFDAEMSRRLAVMRSRPEIVRALDAERPKLAAAQPPAIATPAERLAIRDAIQESFVRGFRATAWLAAALALMSAGVAALMIAGAGPRATVET